MNRQFHNRVRERLDPRRITPGTLVHSAQIALLAIGAIAVHSYLAGRMNDGEAGELALGMGIAVLMAAPRQRGAELLGAVAIWLTTCEFMAACRTGQFAVWRWANMLAALALILIITSVPYLRALARANPWRPLREQDRRQVRSGPGKAWRRRAEGDYVPAAMADIEGRARRIGPGHNRSR